MLPARLPGLVFQWWSNRWLDVPTMQKQSRSCEEVGHFQIATDSCNSFQAVWTDQKKISHVNEYSINVSMFRFFVSTSSNTIEKKQNFVHFPIVDFNTVDYVMPSARQRQFNSYNLIGVSNHYGTLNRGHYTAFCKNSRSKLYVYTYWYQFWIFFILNLIFLQMVQIRW